MSPASAKLIMHLLYILPSSPINSAFVKYNLNCAMKDVFPIPVAANITEPLFVISSERTVLTLWLNLIRSNFSYSNSLSWPNSFIVLFTFASICPISILYSFASFANLEVRIILNLIYSASVPVTDLLSLITAKSPPLIIFLIASPFWKSNSACLSSLRTSPIFLQLLSLMERIGCKNIFFNMSLILAL